MPELKESFPLGPLLINEVDGTVAFGERSVDIPDTFLRVLKLWASAPTRRVRHTQIENAYKPDDDPGPKAKSIKSQLLKKLAPLNIPKDQFDIHSSGSGSYRLHLGSNATGASIHVAPSLDRINVWASRDMSEDGVELEGEVPRLGASHRVHHSRSYDSAPERDQKVDTFPSGDFPLFVEGMILDPASELIHGSIDPATAKACGRLYKASIEDFAFAVVYASKISSLWLPSSQVVKDQGLSPTQIRPEATAELIAQLPRGLYKQYVIDKQLRYGRVLEEEVARTRIREYLETLATALANPEFKKYCQEWLVRGAEVDLGADPTLFDPRADLSTLRFQRYFYESPFLEEVPKIIGKNALDTLTGFLPDTPRADRGKRVVDKYTSKALQRFVESYLLTHFTVMYEYERMAESSDIRTLVSTVRGSVKNRWRSAHPQHEQNVLKRILVRSAMYEALNETRDANERGSLVDMLIWIRDWSEFRLMRERLEALSKLTKSHEESAEAEARKLLAELTRAPSGLSGRSERVGVDAQTVLGPSGFGRIGRAGADDYMRLFNEFFPELENDTSMS